MRHRNEVEPLPNRNRQVDRAIARGWTARYTDEIGLESSEVRHRLEKRVDVTIRARRHKLERKCGPFPAQQLVDTHVCLLAALNDDASRGGAPHERCQTGEECEPGELHDECAGPV